MVATAQGEFLGRVGTWNIVDALDELGAMQNEDGSYDCDGYTFDLEDVEILSDEEWED